MIPQASAAATRVRSDVYAALIAVQTFFASLSVVGKFALREIAPRPLIAVRSSSAALVFLAGWALTGRERVALADHARIVVYALFGVTANQLLFIEGLQRSTATNGVVLGASIPVFTVGVAVLLGRERATIVRMAGLAVALAGALTVTPFDTRGTLLVGNCLFLANSLCYSIYLVISRDLLSRYRPMTVVTWTFVYGALGVLPVGGLGFLHAAPGLSLRAWGLIGYIILFPSIGSYLLNAWALARIESSRVAIFILLQPVIGALLAASFLGERPSLRTFAGGLLIVSGIWLVTWDARRRRVVA